MNNPPWQVLKIIEVAIQFKRFGSADAATGEKIAAAFVLNRADYLPYECRDMVQAWDRLGPQWQVYVRAVKADYMHIIEAG